MNEQGAQAQKESVALVLIQKCHKVVEEIKQVTSILQLDIKAPGEKPREVTTPLEGELIGLLEHLQALLQSYKV